MDQNRRMELDTGRYVVSQEDGVGMEQATGGWSRYRASHRRVE